MFLIQFNLFYNNFIYNCICLIRGLSNNNFLCRAVGVTDDDDLASLGIVDANALQVVIALDCFCLTVGLNDINAAQFLNVEIFPDIGFFIIVYSLVPNI